MTPTKVVLPDADRLAVIEECARQVEAAANGFVEVGNLCDDEEDRMQAYSLADAYRMAAQEIRLMNPEEADRRNRNRAKIKEWMKGIHDGKAPPMPEIERTPRDH